MKAKVWRGETKLGETYETIDIPAELQEKADEYRTKLLEAVAETDESLLEKYFGGEQLSDRGDQGCAAQAHHQLRGLPGAVRQRVQEQGRAAHARRGDRLPALAAGRRVRRRATSRARKTTMVTRKPVDRRAVLGAGVQGRHAPVLRQAHLRPGVLGQGRLRLAGRQRDQGQEGAAGQAVPDALQQREPGGDRVGRPHLRGDRSEGHHDR